MSDWWMTINRTSNGYIVTCSGDPLGSVGESVIQEPDGEFGKVEAGRELLNEVMEHFALDGSKHDAKRLRVEIEDQRGRDYAEEGEKSDEQ